MNKILFCLILLATACNNKPKKLLNTSDVEAASNFMRSVYQGKFDEAATIIINNEANKDCLQKRKFLYNQKVNKNLKKQYKTAGVILEKTSRESATISFFELKDPISNQKMPTLKVMQQNGEWLVDFAYSCSGNL